MSLSIHHVHEMLDLALTKNVSHPKLLLNECDMQPPSCVNAHKISVTRSASNFGSSETIFHIIMLTLHGTNMLQLYPMFFSQLLYPVLVNAYSPV